MESIEIYFLVENLHMIKNEDADSHHVLLLECCKYHHPWRARNPRPDTLPENNSGGRETCAGNEQKESNEKNWGKGGVRAPEVKKTHDDFPHGPQKNNNAPDSM